MIKKTVTYTDLDGVQVTEDLFFNISKEDLADNIDMRHEIPEMQKEFELLISKDDDDSKIDAGQLMRKLIKRFLRIGYGVREGRAFVKDEEGEDKIWKQFRFSPAYDALLWEFYQDGDAALEFLNGLMPKELKEAAEAKRNQPSLPLEGIVQNPTPEAKPAPTLEELREMLAKAEKAKDD